MTATPRFTGMVCMAAMLAILSGLDHCTDSEMEEEDAVGSLVSQSLSLMNN